MLIPQPETVLQKQNRMIQDKGGGGGQETDLSIWSKLMYKNKALQLSGKRVVYLVTVLGMTSNLIGKIWADQEHRKLLRYLRGHIKWLVEYNRVQGRDLD